MLTQSICSNQSYTFKNKNLTSSGIYIDTLSNYLGCDSFVILNFTYHLISNKTFNQTICNNQTYLFKNQQLNSSGTYYDTLPNSNGCDSFITLHLIVLPTSASSISQILCSGQSYYFNNHLINVGGTFADTLQNYVGCDSVITLHLSILPVTSSSVTKTICYNDSVVFNQQVCSQTGNYYDTLTNYLGCDSVIALHLIVLPFNHTFIQASFCQGSSYMYNGNTYTINGIYDNTFVAANGCDSAVTLLLAMKPVDTSVIATTHSLIATANNSYFQWIDCSNHQNISGANDSIFYPKSVGNYAVVVQSKQNLCTDTSACYHIENVGFEQLVAGSGQLVVFPNPASQSIVISHQSLVNTIEVTDVLGRTMMVRQAHHDITNSIGHAEERSISIDVAMLPSGFYFIKATDVQGNVLTAKFVKE
jgi:hypothetical protein